MLHALPRTAPAFKLESTDLFSAGNMGPLHYREHAVLNAAMYVHEEMRAHIHPSH